MKTHYAEDHDDVISSNDTAEEHCWREHKIGRRQLLGDIAITAGLIVALSATGAFWESTTAERSAGTQQVSPAFGTHNLPQRARLVSNDDDR